MVDINRAFPSKYLKPVDLEGREPTVTIASAAAVRLGHDPKLVLTFHGKTKALLVNKTMAKRIAEIAGSPHTEDWVGVSIVLFATETDFAGELVPCIRVKAPPRARATAPPPSPPAPREPGEDDEFDSATRPQTGSPPARTDRRAPLPPGAPLTADDIDF